MIYGSIQPHCLREPLCVQLERCTAVHRLRGLNRAIGNGRKKQQQQQRCLAETCSYYMRCLRCHYADTIKLQYIWLMAP